MLLQDMPRIETELLQINKLTFGTWKFEVFIKSDQTCENDDAAYKIFNTLHNATTT